MRYRIHVKIARGTLDESVKTKNIQRLFFEVEKFTDEIAVCLRT
jgi:hypothetical protein